MGDLVSLITNVGFPIAVASYLLIRFENKIDMLAQSISNLGNIIMSQQKGENQSKSDNKIA